MFWRLLFWCTWYDEVLYDEQKCSVFVLEKLLAKSLDTIRKLSVPEYQYLLKNDLGNRNENSEMIFIRGCSTDLYSTRRLPCFPLDKTTITQIPPRVYDQTSFLFTFVPL